MHPCTSTTTLATPLVRSQLGFRMGLARVAVGRTPAHVPVRVPGGEEQVLWFTPLCYNTSCLSYYETPIVFSPAGGRTGVSPLQGGGVSGETPDLPRRVGA